MRRFYLPPQECSGDEIFLTGREAHHALRVIRVSRGEKVVVLDGAGTRLTCGVQDFDRDKIRLSVEERVSVAPPACQVTLLQGLPRGKIIESIVQKSTELGAWRIVPLLSERATARPAGEDSPHKAEKWKLVAIEAIKQCGAAWLPTVEPPVTPARFIQRREEADLALIGSLGSGARHPRDCFEAFQQERKRRPGSVFLWIGPEGDFTDEEAAAIMSSGAQPITLGPLVLRSETAAIYCLSIIAYELQAA
jgi:16S rRNA (uracil1498-N3)-methyltransferase